MERQVPITFRLGGEPVESVTRLVRSGPYVLTMHTTLPQAGLAVELHSTFMGHNATRTHAAHLLLGPVGEMPHLVTHDETTNVIDPVNRPNTCVYAHCHELIDLLVEHGLTVTVEHMPAQPVPLPR